jgi:hypothetical protein
LPAGSTFKGRAFHFAFTDPKRIRKNLLSSVDYQEDSGDGTEFAVAVKVFGFHGGICSVWVYCARRIPRQQAQPDAAPVCAAAVPRHDVERSCLLTADGLIDTNLLG